LQLAGEDDELTTAPLRALISDFAALLATPADAAATTRIERVAPIGRPLGSRSRSRCSSAGSASLWHPENPAQTGNYGDSLQDCGAAMNISQIALGDKTLCVLNHGPDRAHLLCRACRTMSPTAERDTAQQAQLL
jgi:hypothetical protein